jgi:hypothetical protein
MTNELVEEAKTLRSNGYSMRNIAREIGIPRSTVWDNVFRTKKSIKIHFTISNLDKCNVCEIYMTPEINIKNRFIPMNYKINNTCLACYLREKGVQYADVMSLLDYYGK